MSPGPERDWPAPAAERTPADAGSDADQPWLRAELRAERLDWLPGVLASLDRPFVIERPTELRDLVLGLADRLATSARAVRPPEVSP